MKIINPPELMPPRGFSHAVVSEGSAVYLGGHTAHDRDGTVQGRTLVEQFGHALENLAATIGAAGGRPENLVWLQVFVTDVAEYRRSTRELGPVWGRWFGRHYPAMGLFGVSELADPAAVVELMGIAVLEP
ncbi:MAG TPA: RidA family protein [Solirubrobacteraceae bacterium]|nr:RidA family protein [Solirubrobacteraceae bacterium]